MGALYSRRSPPSVKFTQSDRFGYSLAVPDPRKRLFRVTGIIDNWAEVSGGCGQGDWPNPAGGPTIPRSQLGVKHNFTIEPQDAALEDGPKARMGDLFVDHK